MQQENRVSRYVQYIPRRTARRRIGRYRRARIDTAASASIAARSTTASTAKTIDLSNLNGDRSTRSATDIDGPHRADWRDKYHDATAATATGTSETKGSAAIATIRIDRAGVCHRGSRREDHDATAT